MMNDEQSKRLSEAADSLIQASESLGEARDAVADRRFESEQERDRTTATQQMASRLETASKRIDDALRKAAAAAAATGRSGAWIAYGEASNAVREGRALARRAADADGSGQKQARGEESWMRLDSALETAASLVFPE